MKIVYTIEKLKVRQTFSQKRSELETTESQKNVETQNQTDLQKDDYKYPDQAFSHLLIN